MNIKDLRTGTLLSDEAKDVGSVVWANDNRTIFYTTKDQAKRPYRLHRHTLGAASDDLLYEEKDEMFSIYAWRTRSKAYIMMYLGSLTTTEVRYIKADEPASEWKIIAPRLQDREYDVDHHGDLFYLRVNDTGRNFRLVSAPVNDPKKENWKEIIPHRSEVMLEGMDFFANHYAVYERKNGLPEIRITELKTGKAHGVTFPEPVYSAFSSTNEEWNTTTLRYSYQSLVAPNSVFDWDMNTQKSKLLKQTEVLGGYDATQYTSERLYATAKDGARIPISLVYRKGMKKNSQRQCC